VAPCCAAAARTLALPEDAALPHPRRHDGEKQDIGLACQAKRHPIVLEISRLYRHLKCFAVLRRLAVRYRQIESGAQRLGNFLFRAPISAGLYRLFEALLRTFSSASTWAGKWSRTFALRLVVSAARLSVIGPHLKRLLRRYAKMTPAKTARPSEKIRSVYARWAIKFTPGYYEAQEAIAHER
jgi:hypothetical protein